MNDKTHNHLTSSEKQLFWASPDLKGKPEEACMALMSLPRPGSEEAYREFLRIQSVQALHALVDLSEKKFFSLLSNDSSGKIFILCSSMASIFQGLVQALHTQFAIEKKESEKQLQEIRRELQSTMELVDFPQRSYAMRPASYTFSPSKQEKLALAPARSLMHLVQKAPNGQSLLETSLKHTRAFLSHYNETMPLCDMPVQSTEDAITLCLLINTAVISGVMKAVGIHGIQGCEEKRQAHHIASSSLSKEQDIRSLVEAYVLW